MLSSQINCNKNLSFGSQNFPLRPFVINTNKGPLTVEELEAKDIFDDRELVSKFFIDTFTEGSDDSYWQELKQPKNIRQYQDQIEFFAENNQKMFRNDDGNTTILVGRDLKGKIQAGAIGKTFKDIPKLKTPDVFEIDSVAVDKKFRKNGVGSKLINNLFKTAQDGFTDAVLMGRNQAVPLYESLGFKNFLTLDMQNPGVRRIWKAVQKLPYECPQYVQFMTKTLNENAPRWWETMTERMIQQGFCPYIKKVK